VHGKSGGYGKLTCSVLEIGISMMREHPWALLLSPLLAAVPLVTAGNLLREIHFAHAWGRRLDRGAAFTQEAFLRCGSSSASS
jgi:hypothetical protein